MPADTAISLLPTAASVDSSTYVVGYQMQGGVPVDVVMLPQQILSYLNPFPKTVYNPAFSSGLTAGVVLPGISPIADGLFTVNIYIKINAISGYTLNAIATFTDESGTAQANTLNTFTTTGVYCLGAITVFDKATHPIGIKITLAGSGTINYDMQVAIVQIG